MRLPWSKREPKPKREPRPPAIDFAALEREAEREAELEWERRIEQGDPIEAWLRRRRF
jgi:hypothetical protein